MGRFCKAWHVGIRDMYITSANLCGESRGGLQIRLELLKSTHQWMARRAWSRWLGSFLLVGAIRALEVQWPSLECGSGKIFRQVAGCWWHFLGRIWGVLGGKCCSQPFPCCCCFAGVADCRCRWISSCLRRMLPSRPKRHVQQMPFPLTSLISSAWAWPRAACFAFRVRLYKSCVATSYHPECSYEIHAKNPNPSDAPVRRTGSLFGFIQFWPTYRYCISFAGLFAYLLLEASDDLKWWYPVDCKAVVPSRQRLAGRHAVLWQTSAMRRAQTRPDKNGK